MRTTRRTLLAGLGLLPLSLRAQTDTGSWPVKPIRILVGFPPGQASDIIARAYAEELGKRLGQPVIVENRPGAGATIAAEAAARSPADGYTIYYGSSGPLAIAPNMYAKLNFDPIKDFEPVAMAGIVPFVMVVPTSSPFKSLEDVLVAGRGPNGAMINYGSAGQGSTSHLVMEMLKAEAGLKFNHVAYKGSVPALNDLIGGSTQVALDTISAVLPLLKSARLRALGVSTAKRLPEFPGVPAIAESVPGYEAVAWGMWAVPTATPGAIIERLANEFAQINQAPVVQQRLAAAGISLSERPRVQLKPFMQSELERWGRAVKVSGATLN
jgi:tripartite-type tricarboxylate transporter receptor subunit TctC